MGASFPINPPEVNVLALFRTFSLRHAGRRPVRTALLVLSVALGVSAWTATLLLDATLAKGFRAATVPIDGRAALYVTGTDEGVPRALGTRLAAVPGVRAARPIVIQHVLLPHDGRRPALLIGVDVTSGPSGGTTAAGLKLSDGALAAYALGRLLGRQPVFVGRELARELPQSERTLDVLVAGSVHGLPRAGTIEGEGPLAFLGGSTLVLDDRAAATLTGHPELVSRFDLLLEPSADPDDVRQRVQDAVAGAAEVSTPSAEEERLQDALVGMRMGFLLSGLGALVLASFLVFNVLSVGIEERRRDLGLIRSVGASRGQVFTLMLLEAIGLGLAGSALGLGLGWGLAKLCVGPFQRFVNEVFLPIGSQHLELGMGTATGAAAAGLATVLLASLVPTLRAMAVEPIAALKPAVEKADHRTARTTAAISMTLAGLAVGCSYAHLPGRSWPPLVLAVGAALVAIPPLMVLAARALRPVTHRLLGVPERLAFDQVLRAPGRTGLTTAALAAGVALIVQTGGLIRGNDDAVRDWIDEGIAGDLFVTSGGPMNATGTNLPMPVALADKIRAEAPGALIAPMRMQLVDWRFGNRSVRVLVTALDVATYCEANAKRAHPLRDLASFERLKAPNTALVSENFARLHHVREGATIHLPGTERRTPLRVIGTIADYSCSRGTVFVDRARLGPPFDKDQVTLFDVYLAPGTNGESIRTKLLQTSWAAEHATSVVTRAELQGYILDMLHRSYSATYLQELVAAIVAAMGLVSALWISILGRRQELGFLRALGATPGQIIRVVQSEALVITVGGLAAGMLMGWGLLWYFVRITLVEETGYAFPIRTPWVILAQLVVAGPIFALVAAWIPAMRTASMGLAEAIAED